MICYIPPKVAQSIKAIADYGDDLGEREHFEETYDIELPDRLTVRKLEKIGKAHIFNDFFRVQEWCKKNLP